MDLASDTIVFMVGNFSVKVIQFMLLPLYTASMTTAEYGTGELLNNLNELLYPIICLGIYEALFRFAMDKDADRKKLLGNALVVWLCGACLTLSLGALAFWGIHYEYAWPSVLLLLCFSARMMFAQYGRGIGLVKPFAISGIVNVVALFFASLLLITFLEKGVNGYLYSLCIANFASLIYLLLRMRKDINIALQIDKRLLRDMLKYSVPLVPNSLSWWFNNLANRYIVLFISGNAAAGLFAAASKLPSVINMFTQVFQQSWQISAIKSMDSEDCHVFSTNVFRIFAVGMMVVTSFAIALADLLALVLLRGGFFEAKTFLPLLMVGVLFTSYATFLGAFYTAYKQSARLFSGTLACAVINILVSLCLTLGIGTMGSAIGALIANGCLMILRLHDVQCFVRITYMRPWFLIGMTLLLGQAVLATSSITWCQIMSRILFIVLLIFEISFNLDIFKRILLRALTSLTGKRY